MINYNKEINRGDDKGLIEDTPEYWDYWTEEIRRCHFGYMGLPGRYYFMLKFTKIKDIDKGWMPPWYLDFQHELIERITYNDSIGRNTGVKKGRRKGYTYVAINAILIYDLLFYKGSEFGWGVGDEETLIASYQMIQDCMAHVHPFFFMNKVTDTKDLNVFGWTEKTGGLVTTYGNMNMLYMELMSANTGVFKGKAQRRTIFEEIGKFQKLKRAFNDTKDCWMKGSIQKGTSLLGGTGGEVDKGSKDFMYMVNNPEEFNIDWYFIPAVKGYYPFVSDTGISDVAGATKAWEEKEALLKSKKNKKSLYDFYQNNPMKDEHIFLTLGSGVFDQVLIEAADKYYTVKPPVVQQGVMQFVRDWKFIYAEKGWCKDLVEFVPDPDGKLFIRHWPDYMGDDITGCDPYNQEKSETSDSLGAWVSYRCTSPNHIYDGDKINAYYMDRPERIKTFNDQVFMSTLFYGSMLDFEANQSAELVSSFEVRNAAHILKPRPKAFDTIGGEQDIDESKASNKYGRSINKATKPILVNYIADFISENYMNLWPEKLRKELKFFGSVNTDFAMAFGIARMGAMERYAIKGIDFQTTPEEKEADIEDIGYYKLINGQIVLIMN